MNTTLKEIGLILITVFAVIMGAQFFVQADILATLSDLRSIAGDLGFFLGTFLVLTLFTAGLIIFAKLHYLVRFIIIPLYLVFSITLLVTIDDFLGYAYPSHPPKANILSYRVYLDWETRDKVIETWVYINETGRSRLYKFPWSEEKEDALKAAKGSANGIPQEVDMRQFDETDAEWGTPKGERQDYDIMHPGLKPKEQDKLQPR